jgi:anaerobic selenocysteine-containing dehydrogenase
MIPSVAPGGEVPSGILAEEILEPGDGQIHALFVEGGNPVMAIPDQRKIARAFSSLDLLVTVEPFMSATARLAHYILPPKLMYERADIPWLFGIDTRLPIPFTQYSPPIVDPPEGAELVDDWEIYLGLAKRLDLTVTYCGVPLDADDPLTTDDLLGLLMRDSQVPLAEIVDHPRGKTFDLPPLVAEPARPGATGRFEVMPDDVSAELADFRHADHTSEFTHKLTVRRMRQVMNSLDPAFPEDARRGRPNPAYLHPDDLTELGLADGDTIRIISDHDEVAAIAREDDRLLRGAVSISHCFGGLPGDVDDPLVGVCTNRLIDSRRHHQSINAMPTMSGLPVRIVRSA